MNKPEKKAAPPDEVIDKPLADLLGGRWKGEVTQEAEEPASGFVAPESSIFADTWNRAKFPLLFGGLVVFAGWSAHMGLMDPTIAIPGMCLCSACLGWNIRK